MLEIVIGQQEVWNETTDSFDYTGGSVVRLEHSLFTISKWESKYEKPFLSDVEKTDVEMADYIDFMIVGGNHKNLINELDRNNTETIRKYIESKQTATWFSENRTGSSREVITTELIYYWMIANNIPFECQHWHISRLLTLVRVCGEKNNPPKKRSLAERMDEQRRLNEQRRAAMNTNG